jgi:hypothetical protein
MVFEAIIELSYIGQVEIPAADESTARVIFAGLQGAVLQEVQAFPGINLDAIKLDAAVDPQVEEVVGPAFRINVIKFEVVAGIAIEAADEHEARVNLGTLESQMLDEIGNWPTVELERQSISARLPNIDA